jgi:hypothetical protein
VRACRSSLQATRAGSLEALVCRGEGNMRTERGAALPPVALFANMAEVVGDKDGSYGRDI